MKYRIIDILKIDINFSEAQEIEFRKDINKGKCVDFSDEEIREGEDEVIVAEGVKMATIYREDLLMQRHITCSDPFGLREKFPTFPYSVAIATYQTVED